MLPNLAILVFPEIIGYLSMVFEAQLLSSLPVVLNSTRTIHGGVVESLTFLITIARAKGPSCGSGRKWPHLQPGTIAQCKQELHNEGTDQGR